MFVKAIGRLLIVVSWSVGLSVACRVSFCLLVDHCRQIINSIQPVCRMVFVKAISRLIAVISNRVSFCLLIDHRLYTCQSDRLSKAISQLSDDDYQSYRSAGCCFLEAVYLIGRSIKNRAARICGKYNLSTLNFEFQRSIDDRLNKNCQVNAYWFCCRCFLKAALVWTFVQ